MEHPEFDGQFRVGCSCAEKMEEDYANPLLRERDPCISLTTNRKKEDRLNLNSKKRLLKRENIDFIAKAIAHFAFRNGPVEDMHANNQLSEDDMKILSKYMVNRIAGLLTTIADDNWLQIELLLSYYSMFGTNWDKADPDIEEFKKAFEHAIKYHLKI